MHTAWLYDFCALWKSGISHEFEDIVRKRNFTRFQFNMSFRLLAPQVMWVLSGHTDDILKRILLEI